MLSDVRPVALLAEVSLVVVFAHARPHVLLALVPLVVLLVMTDPPTFLALASSVVVFSDARPAVFLAFFTHIISTLTPALGVPKGWWYCLRCERCSQRRNPRFTRFPSVT